MHTICYIEKLYLFIVFVCKLSSKWQSCDNQCACANVWVFKRNIGESNVSNALKPAFKFKKIARESERAISKLTLKCFFVVHLTMIGKWYLFL